MTLKHISIKERLTHCEAIGSTTSHAMDPGLIKTLGDCPCGSYILPEPVAASAGYSGLPPYCQNMLQKMLALFKQVEKEFNGNWTAWEREYVDYMLLWHMLYLLYVIMYYVRNNKQLAIRMIKIGMCHTQQKVQFCNLT